VIEVSCLRSVWLSRPSRILTATRPSMPFHYPKQTSGSICFWVPRLDRCNSSVLSKKCSFRLRASHYGTRLPCEEPKHVAETSSTILDVFTPPGDERIDIEVVSAKRTGGLDRVRSSCFSAFVAGWTRLSHLFTSQVCRGFIAGGEQRAVVVLRAGPSSHVSCLC
jgi:hypothetical protein